MRAGGLAFLRFAADNRVAWELMMEGRFSDFAVEVRRRQAELVHELLVGDAPAGFNPRELELAAHAVELGLRRGSGPLDVGAPRRSSRAARRLDRRAPAARTTEVHLTHHRIVIVGAGFAGLGTAIRLRAGGHRRLRRARARRRRRRHLARQHLPRLRLRRAVAPLLVLLRPQPGLEPQLLAAAGDPATTCARLRRRVRRTPHIRFDCDEVHARRWDDDAQLWRLETSQGELTRRRRDRGRTGR